MGFFGFSKKILLTVWPASEKKNFDKKFTPTIDRLHRTRNYKMGGACTRDDKTVESTSNGETTSKDETTSKRKATSKSETLQSISKIESDPGTLVANVSDKQRETDKETLQSVCGTTLFMACLCTSCVVYV